jgi:hypothetical protein
MSIQFAPTWNNASVVQTCIRANATDTASAAASTLIDLSVNGVSQFSVDKTGDVILRESTPQTPPSGYITLYGSSGRLNVINSAGSTTSIIGSINGLTDSTQTFSVGTSGTDFAISSASGVHTFNLPDASATARGLVTTGTQTMAGDKTFTGVVRITGGIQNIPTLRLADGNVYGMWHTSNGWTFSDGTNIPVRLSAAGLHVVSPAIFGASYDGAIGWGNTYASTMVTQWREDAANIIGQRNGTNTQVYRVYNTFTNSSNNERLALQFVTYASARYAQLACESAGTGIANMNLVLSPKGTGALIAGAVPDGTATGGNARGAYAVDLQLYRASATQVASGQDSFAAGYGCTASNQGSICIGWGSTSSGIRSIVIGDQSSATAVQSIAMGGGGAVATAIGSIAIGYYCTASGSTAFSVGQQNLASGNRSVATGLQSLANRHGQRAHAAGSFTDASQSGQSQCVEFVLRNKTTDGTTAVTLFLDGATSRLTIRAGTILHATAHILGSKSDGSVVAEYMRQVCIKNVSGTTTLVGMVNTLGVDEAAGTSIAVTADDTNDALQIAVTGVAAETWRWVAVVYGVELAYGT